jgi:hypothetical protein
MGSWPQWISVWCLYAKCILQKCLYEHLSLYLSTRIKIQKRRWFLHSPIPLVKLAESSPNRVTRPWHEQIQQESQIKAVFLEWNEWPQPIPGPFHLLSPPLTKDQVGWSQVLQPQVNCVAKQFSQKKWQHPEIANDRIKSIMSTTTIHDLHGLIKLSQTRSAQQIDLSEKWLGPDLSNCRENQQNGMSNNCQQKWHAVSLEQIRRIWQLNPPFIQFYSFTTSWLASWLESYWWVEAPCITLCSSGRACKELAHGSMACCNCCN